MVFYTLSAFLGTVISPFPVHAGIFSIVSGLFQNAITQENTVNSQNVALLQAATNQDPNPGKGGGDITIVGGSALFPDSGPLGTQADLDEGGRPTSDQISVYVVHKGDTLGGIARMFNVSVNTIRWANNLSVGSALQENQTLVILPISGLQYTVRVGDTIASIAAKHKANANDIASFNGIAMGEKLAVDSELIIPDGEGTSSAPPTASPSRPTSRVRGTGGPSYAGYYMMPLAGARKTQGLHGFNAVDLASFEGAPIMAAAAGDVIIARSGGWNGGYGEYVVLSHDNGTQTLYAHMEGLAVQEGWHVAQGQIVGYEGATGKATGPHLHFEVRGAKNPF